MKLRKWGSPELKVDKMPEALLTFLHCFHPQMCNKKKTEEVKCPLSHALLLLEKILESIFIFKMLLANFSYFLKLRYLSYLSQLLFLTLNKQTNKKTWNWKFQGSRCYLFSGVVGEKMQLLLFFTSPKPVGYLISSNPNLVHNQSPWPSYLDASFTSDCFWPMDSIPESWHISLPK